MNENSKIGFSPHLSAKQLLSTKGICTQIINEYKEVIKVLPKSGVKLFEPNGSWLQNKQIDTCLSTRQDFLKIERVNRLSTLAVAEWLPNEKKAKVIKRSGVEWNNYGKDIRGTLYLIPEEALLLLEMNRIELLYNTLSLSVQQAYALLLNSPDADCTLNEYRVFSQLARLGYRLQRFQYENSTTERLDEVIQPKKKIIVDPDNGRWMGKTCDEASTTTSCDSHENGSREIQKEVEEILNNSADISERKENEQEVSKDLDDKHDDKLKFKIKPRVEIVSEEIIVDPVKLILRVDHHSSCSVENQTTRWSGARIQRNVKLLPKRNDKTSPLSSSVETSKNITTSQIPTHSNIVATTEKRKTEMISPQSHKKSKQEIIELSDDEIEEIPRAMTRMEMLNCIPNIAAKDCIVQTISREYIPHGINPQNTVYQYNRAHILRIRDNNRNAHTSSKSSISKKYDSNDDLSIINSIVPYRSPMNPLISQSNSNNCSLWTPLGFTNFHYDSPQSSDRHYRGLNLNSFFSNHSINSNYNFYMSRFRSPFQLNVFRNFAMVGFALRFASMQNHMNVNQMMCTTGTYQRQQHRRQNFNRNSLPHHSINSSSNMKMIKSNEQRNDSIRMSTNDTQYQASFVKMPANTWTELKRKWKESKTITIEDEDDKMDCSESEVIQCNTQSLINARNVQNISDVYNKLRIIKSAESKIVRRKKGDYKISYKVYASTQHYRKSDPGIPMFYIAITGRTKKFLQPIDLNRLQQDGTCTSIIFACVSDASITFMQAGLITLPNLVS